jgi:hypothetical protein
VPALTALCNKSVNVFNKPESVAAVKILSSAAQSRKALAAILNMPASEKHTSCGELTGEPF